LAERKIEFENYWNRNEDDEEIGTNVDDALGQEMALLINTILWY
jgi:hypothetical protein